MPDTVLAIILGGFFNRWRGGIFNREALLKKLIGNDKIRAVVDRILQGDYINAAAFAGFCYYLHPEIIVPVIAAIMMLRGATPGWGSYIGAAGGWGQQSPEVPYIDKIIERFKDRPRLWGVLGLSLRCGEWGLFIGAPFLTLWPALLGLLAGPVMYVLGRLKFLKWKWEVFEIIIGSLLWLGVVL